MVLSDKKTAPAGLVFLRKDCSAVKDGAPMTFILSAFFALPNLQIGFKLSGLSH